MYWDHIKSVNPMSTPKLQADVVESAPFEPATRPSNEGAYKVFNRVVEWITRDRLELLNITDRINDIVRKSGIREGLVHLQSLHTTTGVFMSEWQDALLDDARTFFEQVVKREQ